MPDQLTLIAKLTAKPEMSETLGAELRAVVAPTRAEAGWVDYLLHRATLLYENWRSRTDVDAHFEQPYLQALLARFPELSWPRRWN